jgi:hypothetical protein
LPNTYNQKLLKVTDSPESFTLNKLPHPCPQLNLYPRGFSRYLVPVAETIFVITAPAGIHDIRKKAAYATMNPRLHGV